MSVSRGESCNDNIVSLPSCSVILADFRGESVPTSVPTSVPLVSKSNCIMPYDITCDDDELVTWEVVS